MIETKFTMKCFAAATLFAERGACSDQIYQPNVNPRQLNFESYIRTSESLDKSTVPSLVWSMLYPQDISWFSHGNPMRFYPYEIFPKDSEGAEGGIRLMSAAPFTYSVEVTGDGRTILSDKKEARVETSPGKLESVRGYSLSVEGFDRTLAVFGFCRHKTNATKTHVEATEVASLLTEIGSVKLGTLAGLQELVTTFRLDRFIDLDSTADLVENHCKVSRAILALCPLRLAAFDGRHRYNLCCHYFHGQFYPTNALFPKKLSIAATVELVTYEGQEEQSVALYENCELFKAQSFVIAIEDYDKGSDFLAAVAGMQEAGNIANASQRLQVQLTWPNAISEITTMLIESSAVKNRKALDASFWGETVVKLPYAADIVTVLGYAEKAKSTRLPLFKGKSKGSWPEIRSAVVKMGEKYTYPIGYVLEAKAARNVPKELAIFATLVKMMGHDPSNYVELRNYFQRTNWPLEQGPMVSSDVTTMRSLNTLQQLILYPVVQAMKRLVQKFVVERHVMEFVWKADGNPHVRDDIGQNWGTFEECDKHYFHLERFSHTEVTESALGNIGSTKKIGKLQFALHAYLLTNALKTFNAMGPNFVLKNKGDVNQNAVLYLR